MERTNPKPLVAIACGGTGGHLFPGLAVGEVLLSRGLEVTLLISPKEVDQQAVKSARGMSVATLPAVGLSSGRRLEFVSGTWRSYRAAKNIFQTRPPHAVLALGGFTAAPPILAGRRLGAVTFLHESNTIPGRANRWLARVVDQAFVGFPSAAGRLRNQNIVTTGTPVRPQFQPINSAVARAALGLDSARPVLLIMGGSQGASGVNELALKTLPQFIARFPELQFIHLTGARDFEKVRAAYASHPVQVFVAPFFAEMHTILGAATAALSRAGASSLAEFAAMQLPSVLIPLPASADNHQFHNARAFAADGAARLLEQSGATPEQLVRFVTELLVENSAREKMRSALVRWHAPNAAVKIADCMLALLASRRPASPELSAVRRNSSTVPRDPQSVLA